MRSRGGGEIEGKIKRRGVVIEERRGAAIDDRRDAAIDDRRSAIVGLELGLWSLDWSSRFAGKVSSSSLFAIWALSFLSLSLSLSLSLRKCFEVKIGTKNNFRG